VTTDRPGVVLRLARESAGLSLDAMARRTHFSKYYLSNIETGKRRATPDVIRAYVAVLGDDVNRRQLLMALLAGVASPSTEVIGRAFELALNFRPLTVDDWLAKLEDYGHEYMLLGPQEMEARLASDLSRLQTSLDHPVLAEVASKLLILQGLTLQTNTMPTAEKGRSDVIRWYQLGIATADRSKNTGARVWARGRAAFALAHECTAVSVARSFANEALALSDTPSVGRLHAQLALANTQALDGLSGGALTTLDDVKRTLDAIGFDNRISDFASPEWIVASTTSLIASRIGEERMALGAQESANKIRPAALSRFTIHTNLHQALMMVKAGEKKAGVALAKAILSQLPVERHDVSLKLRIREIESG
jgi:transcriptional regulator with XRE-family HTH domain